MAKAAAVAVLLLLLLPLLLFGAYQEAAPEKPRV